MKYYSALQRREILTSATTQMNLEDIKLSEISQLQKDKYYMIPLIMRSLGLSYSWRQKVEGGHWGLREGVGELVFNGDRVSIGKNERALEDGWW